MNKLWKIASSPTLEDAAKDVFIKNVLTNELANAVKALQQDSVNKSRNVVSQESANSVCNCIEAIFIHGLKDRLSNMVSLSAVFKNGPNKMPEPDFWPVVMVYSHRDVLKEISRLSQVSTDVGRCRAWIRLALNDGLMVSYLDAMLKDKSTLHCYYRSGAYLRDDEQPDIMRSYIEGMSGFSFQMSYNCSNLNVWPTVPLQMAGIWTLPADLEPVMPAIDAAACLDNDEKIPRKTTKKKPKDHMAHLRDGTTCSTKSVNSLDSPSQQETSTNTRDLTSSPPHLGVGSSEDMADEGFGDDNIQDSSNVVLSKTDKRESPKCTERLDKHTVDNNAQTAYGTPDPKVLEMLHEQDVESPASQMVESWSSSVTDETSNIRTSMDSQSFNILLFSYTQNNLGERGGVLVDAPDLLKEGEKSESSDDELTEKFSKCDSLDSLEFEVVPKHLAILSPKLDEQTKELLDHITTIPREKGLDFQQCKCRGCERPVGMIYGKSRVCSYDGYNYCYDCHINEEHMIPSRVVHNWDFTKYPVSRRAKSFLASVEDEPLLNIKTQNPQLYSVVQEMAQLQYLRVELNFLKSYLLTCRDESCGVTLRKLIWPREYLYEHVHRYSVSDLVQAKNGTLVQLLQKAVAFSKKHVHSCMLCSQKGYICEICNDPQIIYPFDVTTTYHCELCSAVYHNKCMTVNRPCPKCERRRRRETGEAAILVQD